MRLTFFGLLNTSVMIAGLAACATNATPPPRVDSGITGFDAGSMDSGAGADGGVRCTTEAECDDHIACTIDTCNAGNVCGHTPEPSLCTGGQRCSPVLGCSDMCLTNEDCQDGDLCNGREFCTPGDGMCNDAADLDCDDLNECTADTCEPARGCVRFPVCDAGPLGGSDAGTAPPFDPMTHYAGAFIVAPGPSSGCLDATYSINELVFTTPSGNLRAMAGSFPMSQTPKPTGATFDVTYVQAGCGSYRIQGTFSDANNFSGTWTASFSGDCDICPAQDISIIGVRR